MLRRFMFASTLGLVLISGALLGCQKKEETPAEKVGNAIEKAGDKVENATDKVADDLKK